MSVAGDANFSSENTANNGSSCPSDRAVTRFREILSKGVTIPPEDLPEFGWNIPLVTSCEPSPYCIPQELLAFQPQETDVFKVFFKGTSKEVRIRQVFFHTELSAEEQQWLVHFREHCKKSGWEIPLFMESMVLRIIWLAYRKWGDNIITRSFDLAKMMLEWRESFFPLSDQEPELRAMLDKGVMYWLGRDQRLRPLLVIKLSRLHKNAAPEVFKRLTIFTFEWGLRYLMIPGRVETITVLLDVRGVPLHQFPVSALSDMTNTLTKQYPFRLNRMLIINDSFFVQTVWNIAKQFLTEVQQQKMLFFRTGFEEELLKEYTPWQLETCFGGTRPEAERTDPYKNAHRATDRVTCLGVLWEKDCRTPIQWAPEAAQVFKDLSLPIPEGLTPLPSLPVEETKEPTQNSVQDELPNTAETVEAAEPAAASASDAATKASVKEVEATDAVEASVKEGEVAGTVLREVQNEEVQGKAEAKRVESPDPNGDPSLSAPAPNEDADAKDVHAEEPKAITPVDASTAPDQREPEAQTPAPNKIGDKKQSAVEKVGGSKCCSSCSIQ